MTERSYSTEEFRKRLEIPENEDVIMVALELGEVIIWTMEEK